MARRMRRWRGPLTRAEAKKLFVRQHPGVKIEGNDGRATFFVAPHPSFICAEVGRFAFVNRHHPLFDPSLFGSRFGG